MKMVQLAESLWVNVDLVSSVKPHPETPGVTRMGVGVEFVDFAADVPTVLRLVAPDAAALPLAGSMDSMLADILRGPGDGLQP